MQPTNGNVKPGGSLEPGRPCPLTIWLSAKRLPAHADPLHEPRGCLIAGVAGTDDPVPSDSAEPQREHGFGGLGGETAPVVIGVEDETDFSLPVLPADQLQPGCLSGAFRAEHFED